MINHDPVYWVKKHPAPSALTTRRASLTSESDPQNWEQMTDAEIAAWEAAQLASGWVPQPDPVPQSLCPECVSPRQIRRALTMTGLRDTVEDAVAASDQDTKDDWEFSLEIRRDHPLLNAMAEGIGLSVSQVDDLFILAATL